MLGSTLDPPFPWVLAHSVPSYFLSSSATVAQTISVPSASHLGCKGPSWLLQGAAGEAGNAAAAPGDSQ